jgi:hypothetical protein
MLPSILCIFLLTPIPITIIITVTFSHPCNTRVTLLQHHRICADAALDPLHLSPHTHLQETSTSGAPDERGQFIKIISPNFTVQFTHEENKKNVQKAK